MNVSNFRENHELHHQHDFRDFELTSLKYNNMMDSVCVGINNSINDYLFCNLKYLFTLLLEAFYLATFVSELGREIYNLFRLCVHIT